MIFDYTQIKHIFCVGDIHGEFSLLFNTIKNGLTKHKNEDIEDVHPLVKEEENVNIVNDIENDINDEFYFARQLKEFKKTKNDFSKSIIIVAGDCGFGFNKVQYYIDTFKKMNELLKLNSTTLFFVRGNHDDPSYFNENKLNFSNIICVEDYSVILTKNHSTLCVGGAISVDRIWRKAQESRINRFSKNNMKKLYWENEQVIYDENALKEIIDSGIKIDSVVTHSSPSNMFPTDKFSTKTWLKIDKNLKEDTLTERNNLLKIYNFLKEEKQKINFWVYGHFHDKMVTKNEDGVCCIALSDSINIYNADRLIKTSHELDPSMALDTLF